MNWTVAGALLMGAAVGLGAFGAHGLRGRLDASIPQTGALKKKAGRPQLPSGPRLYLSAYKPDRQPFCPEEFG